ncbi:MAG: pectate lyase [Paludibacter sp.]|nr:pectate lyase [Paludibacter sp.]
MKRLHLLLLILFSSFITLSAQQLAFPGAEGYGKYVTGGRGGAVIEVTNLNASGVGSFGAAIGTSGPRTIVFRVSGTITGSFGISKGDLTIAGQTAPGDGICIKGNLSTAADNIIIRYIRVRLDPANGENDAIGTRFHKNIIFDHVTASWSTDETMTLYHNENTTVQWCMISEACEKFVDGVGIGHRFGGIWGNNYGTWHHNLIANNDSRNPRWASGCGFNDYRNNVLYNWGYQSSYGAEAVQVDAETQFSFSTVNMIANYYKAGPATGSGVKSRITEPSARSATDKGSWYVSDNYVNGYPSVTSNNWTGVAGSNYIKLSEPWPAMAIVQQTPQNAYSSVLDHAGCSLHRDAVDTRIVGEARTGTSTYGNNGIITDPSDVGGWPTLNSLPAPTDTDHDGMPDDWETAHNLNPNNATDRNTVAADGYTMLEKYLNGIEFNSPVTGYELTKLGDKGFLLKWADNYLAEDGFIIERSINDGEFFELDMVSKYSNSYTDALLPTTYKVAYRVIAYNSYNETPLTTSIVYEPNTAINDVFINGAVKCYPNPFSDVVNFELSTSERKVESVNPFCSKNSSKPLNTYIFGL